MIFPHECFSFPSRLLNNVTPPQNLNHWNNLIPQLFYFLVHDTHWLHLKKQILIKFDRWGLQDMRWIRNILFQHRHMENVMNMTQFRWQFETIRYGSNPFNNSEWTNVPWVQFPSLLKSNHSFPKSYFKKHQVIHFEFQFPSSIISITFHSVLYHFKSFPNNTNLF